MCSFHHQGYRQANIKPIYMKKEESDFPETHSKQKSRNLTYSLVTHQNTSEIYFKKKIQSTKTSSQLQ